MRVMAPVSAILHRRGFRLLRYLDDWLVLGSSCEEVIRVRDFLLDLCTLLGIRINPVKSHLSPTQSPTYLGMRIQSDPLSAFPTEERLEVFSLQLQEFMFPSPPSSSVTQSPGQDVVSVGSGFSAPYEITPTLPQETSGFSERGLGHRLGHTLPRGSSVVVR